MSSCAGTVASQCVCRFPTPNLVHTAQQLGHTCAQTHLKTAHHGDNTECIVHVAPCRQHRVYRTYGTLWHLGDSRRVHRTCGTGT